MDMIPSSMLEAMYTNFNILFLQGRGSASPVVDRIATVRTSTTREEGFIIPGQLGRLREWLGERVVQNMNAQIVKLTVKDYEGTVGVERNDILDDKLGMYEPMIRDLGNQAGYLWDDLVTDALLAGTTSLAYDGQFFFDTDHPLDPTDPGSATQSNLFATRPLTDDNYAYVRSQGALLRGPDGRALRASFNKLVVGPVNEVTARRIVETQRDTGGADNVLRGTATVEVLPEITGTDWYLIDATNALRPIIIIKRQEPKLVRKDQATDESAFWRKRYHYGVDARGVAGYGPWWLALKATA
jgi:phage major head subunit gpT-like protein